MPQVDPDATYPAAAPQLGENADASDISEVGQPRADFVEEWLGSRASDGKHDPALVALLVEHRKKDIIAEPALFRSLGLYARQLAVDGPHQPTPLSTALVETE